MGPWVQTRRQFALVTQNITLFNDTIANNIAYGDMRSAPMKDIVNAAKLAHAYDFIQEFENKFEELSREVVNQELKNVKIIGEKLFKKDDGKYQYWIAVESPKVTVVNELVDKISKDAKLQLDFDKFQFQKTFDEDFFGSFQIVVCISCVAGQWGYS